MKAIVAVGVLAAACAKTTPGALTFEGEGVRVARIEDVDGCAYLGDFTGGTGARTFPTEWERNQVLNLAGAHGATDVVFDASGRRDVVGKGYRCR